MNCTNKPALSGVMLAAIGVVYGDIGTSPLYTLRECLSGQFGFGVEPASILGFLSLIFWLLILVVSVKYLSFVMRADNAGEGGILTLMSLATRNTPQRWTPLLIILGLIGGSFFYGEVVITPAMSVMSAIEGLKIAAPSLDPYIVPLSVLVLTLLFAIQKHGTATVGKLFAPIMLIWFLTLAVLGLSSILQHPEVLGALNPIWALSFFMTYQSASFFALGAVVLAITGVEALYADMGHFGKSPIRRAWFMVVLPSLVLNYFGQGALLLGNPEAIANPFFLLAPKWALLPLLLLATLATVIASQAVISGAFSVARQSVQMGFLPRMLIVHTSGKEQGQIYVPFTNWTLYLAVSGLVLGFQNSSNLAAAYGIAVTGTMLIDTVLIAFVMVLLWRWNKLVVALLIGALIAVDLAFFAANAIKIPQGGWFPIVVGILSFTLLTTWRHGRALVMEEVSREGLPLDDFLDMVDEVHRVKGTAIFMTSSKNGVPSALLHNLKHNQVLHDRVVLLTVQTADTPYVSELERIYLHPLRQGFMRVVLRYGFMEDPDVPSALLQCSRFGESFDMMETSFYLSRESVIPRLSRRRITRLRGKLFALMSKNATSATDFFRIPTNRVVELGTQLVI